jgi:phospholipid transport system transporter-binding protein
MTACKINQDQDGTYRLEGELNVDTVPELNEQVKNLTGKEGSVAVDLNGVTHADSAGVAMLVEWYRQARQHGRELHFINLPEQMQAIIRVSSLQQVLPISA